MSWMDRIADHLDLPSGERTRVLEELAGHFQQQQVQLMKEGKSALEAESETARMLGDPLQVASALQSVHTRCNWRSALQSAAPFLLLALLPLVRPALVVRPLWGAHLDTSGPDGPVWVFDAPVAALAVTAATLSVIAGLRVLCLALRKIRCGAMNPRVASGLAVGVCLPIGTLVSGQGTSAVLEALHLRGSVWCARMDNLGLSYGLLSLVAAIICASGVKSRAAWASVSVAAVAMAIMTVPDVFGARIGNYRDILVLGSMLVLMFLAGWRVFACSAYGNASYWSLFSAAFFMAAVCCYFVAAGGLYDGDRTAQMVVFGAAVVLACVSLVVFARCSDWRIKKLGLIPGLLVASFLIPLVDGNWRDLWALANIAEQCAFVGAVIVFGMPAAYGLITTVRQPQLARQGPRVAS